MFAFKINYNQKEDGTSGLFNGNITETLWRTSADNIKRKYAYQYDDLNRLLAANYSKPDSPNTLDNYLEKLSYDPAGNILTLERNGNLDPSGGAPVNQIDKLEYSYHPENKNQLLKVNDLSNSPQGFDQSNDIATGDVDANSEDHTDDYTYDANGNMTADTNKGIKNIIYNHLNLPINIYFEGTNSGNISYIYNAIGGKVKKVVEEEADITTTTDYLSGFQYKKMGSEPVELQFFPHAEGYVHYTKPLAAQGGANSALGVFNYVFNYTDHLGNVRLSYARDPLVRNRVRILEENHYYAFGLKHKNYNVEKLNFEKFPDTGVEIVPAPAVANTSYNYKYNGKELHEELGLNMYDYGARNYDPSLGRWMNVDPLAETSRRWSTYTYCYNNPLRFVDPDGMQADDITIKGGQSKEALAELQKAAGSSITLTRDETSGKVSYTSNDSENSAGASELIKIIDDHSVDVQVKANDTYATSSNSLFIGGAFMGNSIESDGTVIANQEINPTVLQKFSDANSLPGTGTLHEVSEAYEGALLSRAAGVSSPRDGVEGSVFNQAHTNAFPQPGEVDRYFTTDGLMFNRMTEMPGHPQETIYTSNKKEILRIPFISND